MKKNLVLISFILIIATISLSSCKHDSMPPIIDESKIPSSICFQDEILPMVQSNCAKSGCHTAGDEDPDLSNYNSIMNLVKTGDPLNSRLYKYAIGSEMPPAPNTPLNLQQVTLLYGWIKQGALNNTCGCDTNIYTFSGAVKPIIQNYCIGCHNTGSPNNELVTYQNIKDKADKILKNITGAGDMMPPAPAAPLSGCKITQISKWINAGKLNN